MTRHDRLSELLAMVLEAGSVHIDDVVAQLGFPPPLPGVTWIYWPANS